MTPRSKESGPDSWTEPYEQLRQHALGEPAPASGGFFGLEALLQHGMAVWMQALPVINAQPEEMGPAFVACDWLATSQRQTTLVLVEMTLSQLFQTEPEDLHGR
jgi:hypothetical protein